MTAERAGRRNNQNAAASKMQAARERCMPNSQAAAGIVGPFDGLDVPWLLKMRAGVRGSHPFLIWAPFDAPARRWSYGEFHERVGALAAGLAGRGVKPGEFLLIHLDKWVGAL